MVLIYLMVVLVYNGPTVVDVLVKGTVTVTRTHTGALTTPHADDNRLTVVESPSRPKNWSKSLSLSSRTASLRKPAATLVAFSPHRTAVRGIRSVGLATRPTASWKHQNPLTSCAIELRLGLRLPLAARQRAGRSLVRCGYMA